MMINPDTDPRLAALEVLHMWLPGDMPVDSIWLGQQLGFNLFTADLSDNVTGVIVKKAGSDPQLYTQKGDSRHRQRFSFARYIGFCLFYAHLNEWEVVDGRTSISTPPLDAQWAKQFAMHLMLPEQALEYYDYDRFTLCTKCQVPMEVVMERLKEAASAAPSC